MEHYIYYFTIFLEIILCVQLVFVLNNASKKVLSLNDEVLEYKKLVEETIVITKSVLYQTKRFVKLLVKIKKYQILKYLMLLSKALSTIALIKALKASNKQKHKWLLAKYFVFG